MLSFAGVGFGPLRTDIPLVICAGACVFSPSGGGVGGKTLRLIGGSDC
jgi:hypothetical protein